MLWMVDMNLHFYAAAIKDEGEKKLSNEALREQRFSSPWKKSIAGQVCEWGRRRRRRSSMNHHHHHHLCESRNPLLVLQWKKKLRYIHIGWQTASASINLCFCHATTSRVSPTTPPCSSLSKNKIKQVHACMLKSFLPRSLMLKLSVLHNLMRCQQTKTGINKTPASTASSPLKGFAATFREFLAMRICMPTPRANKQTAYHTQTPWTLDCELSILLLISQRLLVVAISSKTKLLNWNPNPLSLCLYVCLFVSHRLQWLLHPGKNLQKLATMTNET